MQDYFNPAQFYEKFKQNNNKSQSTDDGDDFRTNKFRNTFGIGSNINKNNLNNNRVSNVDTVDFSNFQKIKPTTQFKSASDSGVIGFEVVVNILSDVKEILIQIRDINKSSELTQQAQFKNLKYTDTRDIQYELVNKTTNVISLIGKKTSQGLKEYREMIPGIFEEFTENMRVIFAKAFTEFNRNTFLSRKLLGKMDVLSERLNMPSAGIKAYTMSADNIIGTNSQL
ncbi:MAG: hypothetical protein ACOC2W_04075, partial [bacterium]